MNKVFIYSIILMLFVMCLGFASASENVHGANGEILNVDETNANVIVNDDILAIGNNEDSFSDEEMLSYDNSQESFRELQQSNPILNKNHTFNSGWNEINNDCLGMSEDNVLGDVNPPGSFQDLKQLITSAGVNATISLDRDYRYMGSEDIDIILIGDKSVTINGNNHTIDGNHQAQIFEINYGTNITLINITFANACADSHFAGAISFKDMYTSNIIDCNFVNNMGKDGGAIHVMTGNLTITRCNFVDNFAYNSQYASSGGAIYIGYGWYQRYRANVTIVDSSFENNSAKNWGGAIHLSSTQEENQDHILFIANCSFVNNTALDFNGGAIHIQNTDNHIIVNCSFVENSAKHGGAIHLAEVKNVNIANCSFVNNSASNGKGDGGSICQGPWSANTTIFNCSFVNSLGYNGGSISVGSANYCKVINCSFVNSTATYGGGAIAWSGYEGSVINCSFVNSKGYFAGAIYWTRDLGSVINCSFVNSTAKSNYGGTIWWSGIQGRVVNCSIVNTAANTYGGAIYWGGEQGSVVNCSIVNTTANKAGGAIWWSGAEGYVVNCSIVNTTAKSSYGGAVYWQGVNGTVVNCSVVNSTAYSNGGAVYWTGGNGVFANSSFVNSTAGIGGGAVYWTGRNGVFANSSFVNSTAYSNGGAVYWTGGNGVFANSSFVNSIAKSTYGGAVYWSGTYGVFANSSFVNSTASSYGGAVYWSGTYGVFANSSFVNSTAGIGGGAIYWQGLNGTVVNSSFEDSYANEGSAVYWNGKNGMASYSNFTNNVANAATFAAYGDNIQIIKCNFINNTARYAGGILIHCHNVLVDFCNFTNNSATRYGGGAINDYNFGYSDSVKYYYNHTVSNSIFNDNFARIYGGAISLFNATVINSTFSNNSALYGGAIFADNLNISGLSFSNNNAIEGNSIYALHSASISEDDSDIVIAALDNLKVTNYNSNGLYSVNVFSGLGLETLFYPHYPYPSGNKYYTTSEGWLSDNLGFLRNSLTGEDVSEYLKIYIYRYFNPNLRSLASQIFIFTDEDFRNSTDGIVNSVLELYDSGYRVPSQKALKKLDNGSYLSYTFKTLVNPSAVQNAVLFKVNVIDVDLKKEALNQTAFVGESVEFRISIKNIGNEIIENIFIIDDDFSEGLKYQGWRPEVGNWTFDAASNKWILNGSLDSGENVSIILSFITTNNGTLINNATVGINNINLNVSDNVTVYPIVDLVVNKTVSSDVVYSGNNVVWIISVVNNGPSVAVDAYVEDVLPNGLTFISANASKGQYDSDNGRWTIGNLAKGETVTLNITTVVGDVKSVTNNVFVNCSTKDSNMSNNYANATVNVAPFVDLAVDKSVSKDIVHVGDTVIWTITVINNGSSVAVDAYVEDVLPNGLTFISANASKGQYDESSGLWIIGDLDVKETVVLYISTKVGEVKSIVNSAFVNSSSLDIDMSNNYANESINVIFVADLAVYKSVSKKFVRVGDRVIWTITVVNNGPNSALNVVVNEILSKDLSYVHSSASKGSYDLGSGIWLIGNLTNGETATLQITTIINKVSGIVNNFVNVSSDTYDSNMSNNEDYVNITVVGKKPIPNNETDDFNKSADGNSIKVIDSKVTGNPIFVLLVLLFSLILVPLRKRKI